MFFFLCSKSDGQDSPLVEQFIARKADILFCPTWKTATHKEEEQEEEEEEEDATGLCLTTTLSVRPHYAPNFYIK